MAPKRHGKLSQAQICKEVGITPKTLRAWRDEEGVDITSLDAVKARAADMERRMSGAEDSAAVKLRKLKAEADILEHKLAVQRGDYVSRESQLAAGMQFGLVIRGIFQRMDTDLTPRLAGRTSPECSKILKEYSRAKLLELSHYECDIKVPVD